MQREDNYHIIKLCALFIYEYIDDAHINICYSNDLNCSLLKIHPEDYIGINIFDLSPKIFTKQVIDNIHTCVKTESSISFTFKMPDIVESDQNWLCTFLPIRSRGCIFITGICQSVREFSYFYFNFLSNDTIDMFFRKKDEHIVFTLEYHQEQEIYLQSYSSHCMNFFDSCDKELLNSHPNIKQVFSPQHYWVMISRFNECINTQQQISFIYCRSHENRPTYWRMNISLVPSFDEYRLVCSAHNITEYYMTKENIQSIIDNFFQVFDNSTAALATINVSCDGVLSIESCNQKYRLLFPQYESSPQYKEFKILYDELKLNPKPINMKYESENIKGCMIHYDISAVPLIENGQLHKIILSIISDEVHPLTLNLHNMNIALTPREKQILEYVGNGEKNQYIAYHLHISEGTVKKILSNAYRKLNVSSRTELIKRFFHP